MTAPDDLRPTVSGRLLRRAGRALASPVGQVLLALLALALLAWLFSG